MKRRSATVGGKGSLIRASVIFAIVAAHSMHIVLQLSNNSVNKSTDFDMFT